MKSAKSPRSHLLSLFRIGSHKEYIDTWEKLDDDIKDKFPYPLWRFAAVSYDQYSLLSSGKERKNFQQKALSCIQEALQKSNYSSDALRSAGMIQLHQNKLEKALYFYQKAYTLNKKDPLSLIALGNIFGAQKKYDKAIGWYKKSIPYRTTKLTASINLALTYSKMHKIKDGKEYAQKAIGLIKKNNHKTFVSFLPQMEDILKK